MSAPGKFARLVSPEEFRGWIIHESASLLAVDKPAGVVCHPSKAGPRSSLAGAAREHCGLAAAHLAFRLDRETSGVVVFAKDPATAARLQGAVAEGKAGKVYYAVLTGTLERDATVDQPLGPAGGEVKARTAVTPDGKRALTRFEPLGSGGGFTLARVTTATGRKHQIRAHAQWLGLPLAGDKLYGPDERLFLDFIRDGWTPALAERLLLPRQALHCAEADLRGAGAPEIFRAPFPPDLRAFCAERGVPVPDGI